MTEKTKGPQESPAGEAGARVRRAGHQADRTPPPDHPGFVEARSHGLRAVRENLARRKKTP